MGVKRNIFQQISHVCLIMYITACGAEKQSTTAAIATHPPVFRGSTPSGRRSLQRPASLRVGGMARTRSPLYFILIINSSCAWPIAIRRSCRNAKFHGGRESLAPYSPDRTVHLPRCAIALTAPRNFLTTLNPPRSVYKKAGRKIGASTWRQLKRNYAGCSLASRYRAYKSHLATAVYQGDSLRTLSANCRDTFNVKYICFRLVQ